MSDSVRPHRRQPTRLPSLGFSRQEYWSRLPFPSPVHESEVTQSCPTLCDPMDYSLPGCSIHGISQARVLEWVAIVFSNSCILRTFFFFLWSLSMLGFLFRWPQLREEWNWELLGSISQTYQTSTRFIIIKKIVAPSLLIWNEIDM